MICGYTYISKSVVGEQREIGLLSALAYVIGTCGRQISEIEQPHVPLRSAVISAFCSVCLVKCLRVPYGYFRSRLGFNCERLASRAVITKINDSAFPCDKRKLLEAVIILIFAFDVDRSVVFFVCIVHAIKYNRAYRLMLHILTVVYGCLEA